MVYKSPTSGGAGKEGEIEMKKRRVAFLKAVQRSFIFMPFLVLVLSSNSLADTFMFMPATGQTTCYDGSGNVVACTPGGPISQAGDPLPYKDNGNGTVTDNTTGLMWQKNENPSFYNWYQASGKYHATYNPSSQNVCGSLNVGSYSDWRLPTKKELLSIVDSEIPPSGPTIDAAFFPDTYAAFYWSSTTASRDRNSAWAVDFLDGTAASGDKGSYNGSDGLHVRCVRGSQVHLRAYSTAKTK